jgi:hypothetical protein
VKGRVDNLLSTLHALEVELHHPGVACDVARLEQLLHPDFHEVGRSGRPLGAGVALLTYRSAHRRLDGSLEQHTYRSSVWVEGEGRWQLLYHQGTPTEGFA